jgi:hypothetical protein
VSVDVAAVQYNPHQCSAGFPFHIWVGSVGSALHLNLVVELLTQYSQFPQFFSLIAIITGIEIFAYIKK